LPASPFRITRDELELAFSVLQRHGCSDLFPHPFEVECLIPLWSDIVPLLTSLDLREYQPKPPVRMVAPKLRYAVRQIQLIDPLDFLIVTALTVRLFQHVEANRVPKASNVVFSCRFHPNRRGDLYSPRIDYNAYDEAIRSKAANCKYVGTADIVDFYQRIYIHRLENSLTDLSHAVDEISILKRFWMTWSQNASYGIPIGPIFSSLLGEVVLDEVDKYMLSRGVDFVRYIDDYVIFGESEASCLQGIFILGERLQSAEGLSLNSSKTTVMTSDHYLEIANSLGEPSSEVRRRIVQEIFGGNPYELVDYDSLGPQQKELLNQIDFGEILHDALESDGMTKLLTVKFILNTLTGLDRPEMIDPVLDHLQVLYPVSHAVSRFLSIFNDSPEAEVQSISDRIMAFLKSTEYVPDFQHMWLLQPFQQSGKWNQLQQIRLTGEQHRHEMVRRQAILAVGASKDRGALLDFRHRIDQTKDWERRSIIYACRWLPDDERRAFLQSLRPPKQLEVDTLLEKATIEFCRKS
jgi:hypothetical protein